MADDHSFLEDPWPHLAALARTLDSIDGTVVNIHINTEPAAGLTDPNQVAEAMQRWERHNTPQRRT